MERETVKQDFREAFWQLYSQQGLEGMTTSALCERAGYSRSSFYRCYQSIYDLLDSFEEEALPRQEMQRLLDNIDKVGMREVRQAFLDFFDAKTELLTVLCRFDRANRFSEKFRETIFPVFLGLTERSLDLEDEVAEALAEYITASKVSLFKSWARSRAAFDIKALLQVTDGVFEAGYWDLVESTRADAGTGPVAKLDPTTLMGSHEWLA